MKKLKIAFLSAGNLSHIIPYLYFFRERGHSVSWITYETPKTVIDVPTYDISFVTNAKRRSSKWKYLLSGIAIKKVLKQVNPDILHGHYVTSSGVICLMSGFSPYVLTVHGSDLIDSMKSSFWKSILRYSFKKAALVNTVSDELASLALQLDVPQEKVLVATVGVDTKVFIYNPHKKFQSPVRLLCTRRLEPVFDPVTIINACEILCKRNISFTLTFAASGSLQKSLENLVVKKGFTDIINFLGGYNNTTLPTLLQNHDFYISASIWDGTSISLLEAMASGIYPIVSRIKSNQAWLQEGKSAFMFECGNSGELADKIALAISSFSYLVDGIVLNRQIVAEKGDREKNLSLIEKRYYQVVGSNI